MENLTSKFKKRKKGVGYYDFFRNFALRALS